MNEVGGRNYNVKEKKGMGDLKGEGRTHISLFVAERLSTMDCGLAG